MKIKLIKNKKAYYNWSDIFGIILCFAIIAIGIGIGIFAFYSQTIDIRQEEADIIYDKLVSVVIKDNKLNQIVLNENFSIYEYGLNKKIINEYYYFKIEIFQGESLVKKIEEGNRDFEVECFLKSEKFPKCHYNELNLDYMIKILTASNQIGRSL